MVARRVLVQGMFREEDKVVAQVEGVAGEEFEGELHQSYGLSANPSGHHESLVIENNGSPDNYVVLPPSGYELADEGETIIYSHQSRISIKDDTITIIVGTKKKLEIKDDKIILHADLEVNGNINVTGDVVAGGISFNEHIHAGVKAGSESTLPPSKT